MIINNLTSNPSKGGGPDNGSARPDDGNSEQLNFKRSKIYNQTSPNRDYYNRNNVYLISDSTLIQQAINKYDSTYSRDIADMINQTVNAKENFFAHNILVISPFLFSSSEEPIEITKINTNPTNNEFVITFSLYTPEYIDMDIRLQFYLLEVRRENISTLYLDNATERFIIENKIDKQDRSAYYS